HLRAPADSHFWVDRHRQRHLLLVSARTSSSEGRRLQLGHLGGARSSGAQESLQRTHATVPLAGGAIRIAFCVDASINRRRSILRDQFVSAGIWADSIRLLALTHLSCLSLLGWISDRTMATADHGQRVYSLSNGSDDGEASARNSGVLNSPQHAWHFVVRHSGCNNAGGAASMAMALGRQFRSI